VTKPSGNAPKQIRLRLGRHFSPCFRKGHPDEGECAKGDDMKIDVFSHILPNEDDPTGPIGVIVAEQDIVVGYGNENRLD
jgi:hypothetical protein